MPDDHMPAFERTPSQQRETKTLPAICAHHKTYDSTCNICYALRVQQLEHELAVAQATLAELDAFWTKVRTDQRHDCQHGSIKCGVCEYCGRLVAASASQAYGRNTLEALSDRWLRSSVASVSYTDQVRASHLRLLVDVAASADGKGYARAKQEPKRNDICRCARCGFITINPGDNEHCPNCNNELYPVSKLVADGGCFDPMMDW